MVTLKSFVLLGTISAMGIVFLNFCAEIAQEVIEKMRIFLQ